MNEKLQKYALIAEIVGGIAIVLSLLFVGLQVRENNVLNRVEAYDRNIEALKEDRRDIFGDPEMAELYRAWFDDDIPPLSGNDRFRMIHLSRNIFGSYEKAYFSYSLGIMGAPEWTRYERQICVQKERLDHHDVVQTVFDVLSDEFQSVIVKLCG